MKNHTRQSDQRDAQRDDERAHAIYKDAEGRDYCREDAPRSVRTYEAAVEWAERWFTLRADSHARATVAGFAVEWW